MDSFYSPGFEATYLEKYQEIEFSDDERSVRIFDGKYIHQFRQWLDKLDDEMWGQRGHKARRSRLYGEIVELNRQRLDIGVELGMRWAVAKKLEEKPGLSEEKALLEIGVIHNVVGAWEAEAQYKDIIMEKEFARVIINGKEMEMEDGILELMNLFDSERNKSYMEKGAGTPRVVMEKDYVKDELRLDFYS